MSEFLSVACGDGMQNERRQREVIDQLRFVRAIAEIRNIVRMRYVCLGDKHDVRRDFVQNRSHQLNDAVRLQQVDARRADFLPEIRDGVESDESRTLCHGNSSHFCSYCLILPRGVPTR